MLTTAKAIPIIARTPRVHRPLKLQVTNTK
jgi:hypothetical protein